MSRSHDAHDSFSQFDAAAAAYENPDHAAAPGQGHDPFGHAESTQTAQPAPVQASPSLVPSVPFSSSAFDSAGFDDSEDLYPSAPKKRTGLFVGAFAAVLAGVLFVGNHFVAEGRAEEQRLAEIAKVQQTMAELEAKRRAAEAIRPEATAPTEAPSSVAALLAASTISYGAAQSRPQAQKPNGLNAARQAAAIQRALAGPGVARRSKVARGARAPAAKRGAGRTADEALNESHSNDPIYGL